MSAVHTADQERFLREAIALAHESIASGGGPFGAVVVKDGAIVGRGQNDVTKSNDPTAHAEIVAIRDACRRLQTFSLAGCEMYASSEPCPMCLGGILWSRIDGVWFGSTREDAAAAGFDDRRFYEELLAPPGERTLPMQTLLRDEARSAFAAWARQEIKTHY